MSILNGQHAFKCLIPQSPVVLARAVLETPGKQTSAAFEGSDQLWVVATGDRGLSLLRVDKKGTAVGSNVVAQPRSTSLAQNYPNPFDPSTTISVTLGARDLCIVRVYDVLGREVATLMNEVQGPGLYRLMFDGTGLPSGAYYCRLEAGGHALSQGMLLIRQRSEIRSAIRRKPPVWGHGWCYSCGERSGPCSLRFNSFLHMIRECQAVKRE